MLGFLLVLLGGAFELDSESPEVRACLDYLKGPRFRDIRVGLERSVVYVDVFREVFRREGVPEDLLWLALIESGFDATATSPTGAQGMFQFKKTAARAFGLIVDDERDDRNHPMLAARACARYLAYLSGKFDSWDLVLAAYNLGEGDLRRAMLSASVDTWGEVKPHVRLETQVFVPKVKAAAILGNTYMQTESARRRMRCATYHVKKGDTLFGISRGLGLDVATLKEINDLTHDVIYVGQILIIEPE